MTNDDKLLFWSFGNDFTAARTEDHDIFNSDAIASGKVYSRLRTADGILWHDACFPRVQRRTFVNIQTKAVSETMAEIRTKTGILNDSS